MNKYVCYTISTIIYQILFWSIYYVCTYSSAVDSMSFINIWAYVSPILYYIVFAVAFKDIDHNIGDYLYQVFIHFLLTFIISQFVIVSLYADTPETQYSRFMLGIFELGIAIVNCFMFVFTTIIYGVYSFIKKKKSMRVAVTITICIVILLPVIYAITFCVQKWSNEKNIYYTSREPEYKKQLNRMLENKDEEISYTTEFSDNLLDSNYKNYTVFIDYDTKTVGFLFSDKKGFDTFELYNLVENKYLTDYYPIQKEWNLNSPGKKLTTYRRFDDDNSLTCRIELEMQNGSVFSIDCSTVGGDYLAIED